MDASVVDLFCGIGGISKGFADEGFEIRTGVDFDPAYRKSYEDNIKAKFGNAVPVEIGRVIAGIVKGCLDYAK